MDFGKWFALVPGPGTEQIGSKSYIQWFINFVGDDFLKNFWPHRGKNQKFSKRIGNSKIFEFLNFWQQRGRIQKSGKRLRNSKIQNFLFFEFLAAARKKSKFGQKVRNSKILNFTV